MKLARGNVVFQLSIDGYQFSELSDIEWDSDWLNIYFSLSLSELHWEKLDPSLTTFEIQDLINWMEEVADHAGVFRNWRSTRLTSRIFFAEPNLGFEALSGSYEGTALTFRLYLAAENLPPFQDKLSGYDPDGETQEVWFDFPIEAGDLRDAARSLQQQLSAYPIRVDLPRPQFRPTKESDES